MICHTSQTRGLQANEEQHTWDGAFIPSSWDAPQVWKGWLSLSKGGRESAIWFLSVDVPGYMQSLKRFQERLINIDHILKKPLYAVSILKQWDRKDISVEPPCEIFSDWTDENYAWKLSV